MSTVPLALLLLRASRWFDRQLLDGLQHAGWPPITPAQSLVFAYLEPDGTPPAELARRLGHTRQATHQLVTGLVALDLLTLLPNPARRGGLLVTLTNRGQSMTHDAHLILRDLEHNLGDHRIARLRTLLNTFDQLPPAQLPAAQLPPVPSDRDVIDNRHEGTAASRRGGRR